ncbi:tyrosine-type recombinase/integrase [Methylomonas sp. TEB]|uniref:tyrosine-type recombinase/integrase n=1 Tax=Methylomonas sp. TEB TaxID=3398229 RepID=UPI0039F516B3
MSLIKRPNTQNWYYLFQFKGKKYFGSTGTPKKTLAAKVEAKKREEAIAEQLLGEAPSIKLSAALEQFKQSRVGTSNFKNVLTYSNKLLGFKLDAKTGEKISVAAIGKPDMKLHEITNKHVKALVSVRKAEQVGHWTIKHELQALRSTIQLAGELGYKVNTEINWATKDLKTKKGRLRFLTSEEERRLLTELDPNRHDKGMVAPLERTPKNRRQMQDNYDLVVALLDTGMRYDEMAKLPWSSVDMESGIIRIYRSKVDSADTFYMTSRLIDVMLRRNENRTDKSRYVFEGKNGDPRGYVYQGIKKAMERAGLNEAGVVTEKGGKVTIHTLRHTFASRLVQNGVSLAKVSKLLGHASITTTEIYAHLAPNEASEEAVRILNYL